MDRRHCRRLMTASASNRNVQRSGSLNPSFTMARFSNFPRIHPLIRELHGQRVTPGRPIGGGEYTQSPSSVRRIPHDFFLPRRCQRSSRNIVGNERKGSTHRTRFVFAKRSIVGSAVLRTTNHSTVPRQTMSKPWSVSTTFPAAVVVGIYAGPFFILWEWLALHHLGAIMIQKPEPFQDMTWPGGPDRSPRGVSPISQICAEPPKANSKTRQGGKPLEIWLLSNFSLRQHR